MTAWSFISCIYFMAGVILSLINKQFIGNVFVVNKKKMFLFKHCKTVQLKFLLVAVVCLYIVQCMLYEQGTFSLELLIFCFFTAIKWFIPIGILTSVINIDKFKIRFNALLKSRYWGHYNRVANRQ